MTKVNTTILILRKGVTQLGRKTWMTGWSNDYIAVEEGISAK